MARIRFIELPAAVEVFADDVIPVDGATTRKATAAQIVAIGRPMASEAQAIAGESNVVGMSPLTTKQALDAQPAFTGDSGEGGVKGLVPAPAAGNGVAGYFLQADGTWGIPPEGNVGDVDPWNAALEYEINNAVSHDGKIWGALSPNINKEPGVDPEWDFIVGATGGTFTTPVTVPTSTTISAGFNLDNGTAPTSPVNGDIWGASNGLYRYIGGFTTRILTNNDFTSFPLGSQIGFNDAVSFASATITGAGNVVTFDNNPFLVSEGTEIGALSYAAKMATGSKIVLEAQIPIGATTTGFAFFGMFRGSTLVGVAYVDLVVGMTRMVSFKNSVAAHPGNTTSATYSLRAAVSASANSYPVNFNSSTLFGGNQVGVVFSLREVRA